MFEQTVKIIREFIENQAYDIKPETTLVDELGLNSLDVINIVVAFEEEFDIEIPDRVIPGFRTIGDIAAYLEKNV